MTDYPQWAARHPAAAADLQQMLAGQPWSTGPGNDGQSEAATQQQVRLSAAKQGAMSWRNNIGATPASTPVSCPSCGLRHEIKQVPVRYGLANDSRKLNGRIKSSDLILAIPRLVTADMVGTTVAQFGAVECKAANWTYRGNEHEQAQAAWLALVTKLGGFACFSTGGLEL